VPEDGLDARDLRCRVAHGSERSVNRRPGPDRRAAPARRGSR
jgi:hypothetical protein